MQFHVGSLSIKQCKTDSGCITNDFFFFETLLMISALSMSAFKWKGIPLQVHVLKLTRTLPFLQSLKLQFYTLYGVVHNVMDC